MAAAVFVLLCVIFLLACDRSTADTLSNTPLKSSCAGNYSAGNQSTFEANLNNLFSSLNDRAPISNFYNATSGDAVAERAYGLYMCQGDLSSDDCRSCVVTATAGVLQSCPSSRQGIIWYDYCQVRFSDYNFFGVADARGDLHDQPLFDGGQSVAAAGRPRAPGGERPFLALKVRRQLRLGHRRRLRARAVYGRPQPQRLQGLPGDDTAERQRLLQSSVSLPEFLFPLGTPLSSLVFSRCSNESVPAVSSGGRANWETNLGILLSSLASNTERSGGFNTTTVREIGSDWSLYGLALCRGDLANSPGACRTCLANATRSMVQDCPRKTGGIIWIEQCEVRYSYSKADFFGSVDEEDHFYCSDNLTSAPAVDAASRRLMQTLVEAAPGQNLLFAAGSMEINLGGVESIFGLVQCTRDLYVSEDCRVCLIRGMANAVTSCSSRSAGWRSFSGSCNLRYESFAFFNTSVGLRLRMSDVDGDKKDDDLSMIVHPQCADESFPAASSGGRANWRETNLSNFLSSLASNTARSGGFSTATVEEIGSAWRLYGLALCRGDVANSSTGACRTCLANATRSMVQMCPGKTQGIIWYEQCEVRYSNESFFGVVDRVGRTFCGVKDTSPAVDAASLSLMSRLVEEAPGQKLLFAAGSVEIVSGVESSYGLVQCTRDLSSEDCRSCLKGGMANASSDCPLKRGWRYLSGSCNLRYEDLAFFNTSVGLRMPNVDDGGSGKLSKALVAAIVVAVLGAVLLGFLIVLLWQGKRRAHHVYGQTITYLDDLETLGDTELHLVDLRTIVEATNNFADRNKIGGGGFGTVYKGVLRGGEEIAIKRLSTRSNQGPEEFKNEVILIAKLQHRNLLRVLGCCLEGEEKMIIYEYMPNRSLDGFIFDEGNRSCLGWEIRFSIIGGIARGLLYLHEDSQLKIIHRDLKPSNVLLDREMNPKISDFGMAKIIRQNEINLEAISGRIVGTYGYLAPEYALHGVFSVKSDVFSFGVLLLEIVSGQKNGSLRFLEHGRTLLQHTWQLWAEGEELQMVDPLIAQSCPASEVLRCIRIGLLCVQESPVRRPTMSSVALMLMSSHVEVPEPSRPPSFAREGGIAVRSSTPSYAGSVGTVSITNVFPR